VIVSHLDSRVDACGVDLNLGGGGCWFGGIQEDSARHAAETAAYLRDHHVPDGEFDLAMLLIQFPRLVA
jgi:hypothetical protein